MLGKCIMDFKAVCVKDPEIAQITDDLLYQVRVGASSNTFTPFTSTSAGNSAVSFNVLTPNENIVVSRQVLMRVPMSFQIQIARVPVNSQAFQYGLTDCIGAFPFASLVTTASVNINNCTTSETTAETLYPLLRLNDTRELLRYNSQCPSTPDFLWGKYSDAVNSNSNPLASGNNASYDPDMLPRGAFPAFVQLDHFDDAGDYLDASPVSTSINDTWVATVMLLSTEPVF